MIPQSKYNGCIEIWRYVLTFFVGLMHFYYCYLSSVKLFEGFYVAVDFFFMLSGFYLINTLNKSQLTAVAYTIRKYKTFFIIYSSSILYYVIESFTVGIKNGVNTFIKSTPDFLCLQMTGVFYPHTNGILWYISAMMVAGFFLASFFKLYPETTCKVLFPAFAILGYSYILLGNNNLDVTYLMNGKHIIPPGVIRAFSGMSIGGGIYLIFNTFPIRIKVSTLKISILELGVIIFSAALVFKKPHTNYDFLQIILFPVIIICSLIKHSIWSNLFDKIGNFAIRTLGKQYTLAMYCHSLVVASIMTHFLSLDGLSTKWLTIIYVVTWIIFTYLIVKMNDTTNKYPSVTNDNKI